MHENETNPQMQTKKRISRKHHVYLIGSVSFFTVSLLSIIFAILVLSKIIPPIGFPFEIFAYIMTIIIQIITGIGYITLGLITNSINRDKMNLGYKLGIRFKTFNFFILAALLIANEAFATYVELSCVGEGCLLFLPLMITVPAMGLFSLLAFFEISYLFPQFPNKKRNLFSYPRIILITTAILEFIRYLVNGILGIQINVKFSCSLCEYSPLVQGYQLTVLNLVPLTNFSVIFLFILNYILTPIYLTFLGLILLQGYRDKKIKIIL